MGFFVNRGWKDARAHPNTMQSGRENRSTCARICRGAWPGRIPFEGAMNVRFVIAILGLYPQVRQCILRDICEISDVDAATGVCGRRYRTACGIENEVLPSANGHCSAARQWLSVRVAKQGMMMMLRLLIEKPMTMMVVVMMIRY